MLAFLMRNWVPYYTIILWAVSAVHVGQAVALLLDGDSVGTTSIISLTRNTDYDVIPFALHPYALATLYILGAVLATRGIVNKNGSAVFHFFMWALQQVLVFFAMWSAGVAIVLGYYLDGVGAPGSGISFSRAHMFSDQFIYIVMGMAHFLGFFMWRKAVQRGDHVVHYYEELIARIKKANANES